jgi:hypothetical protein
MCSINTLLMVRLLLESIPRLNPFGAHQSFLALVMFYIFSFLFHHLGLFSLACGAAVSGFGLWLVSRWASKNEAALPAVRHGS